MRYAILLAALAASLTSCSLYDAAVGPQSPPAPSGAYTLEATVTPVAPDAQGAGYTLTHARVAPETPAPSGNSFQLTDVVLRPAPETP